MSVGFRALAGLGLRSCGFPESFGIVVCRFVGTGPDILGLVWPSFRPESGSKSKIPGRILQSSRGPLSSAESCACLLPEGFWGSGTCVGLSACLKPSACACVCGTRWRTTVEVLPLADAEVAAGPQVSMHPLPLSLWSIGQRLALGPQSLHVRLCLNSVPPARPR